MLYQKSFIKKNIIKKYYKKQYYKKITDPDHQTLAELVEGDLASGEGFA